MSSLGEWKRALTAGACDARLKELYGESGVEGERLRWARLAERFAAVYGESGSADFFSAPGRTELGGNHTDHQHGRVLAASVNVDAVACAAPNGEAVIRVASEGYPDLEVRLDSLEPRPEERGASAALVRGMAAGVRALGYEVGGFNACVCSSVPAGSGLSSSAAYEVLMGGILDRFFCGGALGAVRIAKLGQSAENHYFGKPCGLMDQMASSVGGCVAIDFADPADPAVRRVEYDFSRSGHCLCIVDTGSCHADLTDDYAAIPGEMAAVAARFGKAVLREVPEERFRAAVPELRRTCGDRAVLRAMHFYADDRRADREARALEAGDFDAFLALMNASGDSSALCLENTWSASNPRQQAVPLALAWGRELLGGAGAIRVHGGGFAGTIQAFVPEGRLEAFRAGMEGLLGAGACHVFRIRPVGGCAVTLSDEVRV